MKKVSNLYLIQLSTVTSASDEKMLIFQRGVQPAIWWREFETVQNVGKKYEFQFYT